MINGVTIRITVATILSLSDIPTNKKTNITIMIKAVNNTPNNFLKSPCDILM
jgi:hypothetical protein